MSGLEIAFILCLLLSAFFSGTEMAFVSSNKVKMREKADSGDSSAAKIVSLQNTSQHFLAVLLIGNNIVNILGTALLTYWLQLRFGVQNEWIVTLIMAPLLIVFGEMVPKDYCRVMSSDFLLRFSTILSFLMKVFRGPAVWVMNSIRFFLKPLGPGKKRSIFVSEKEFRLLIEESTKSGVLDKHEKKLIDKILDLETTKVQKLMVPVGKVAKVDIHDRVGRVKELARQTGARMVLVYEEIPSIIVGMVYVFDVLFDADDKESLRQYLRSPVFLADSTSMEKAFLTLQDKRQSFAVVTDRDQEVTGVVPIERLFTL